jgi:hypothetical protein
VFDPQKRHSVFVSFRPCCNVFFLMRNMFDDGYTFSFGGVCGPCERFLVVNAEGGTLAAWCRRNCDGDVLQDQMLSFGTHR